ncbi:NIL domain-containing protein [Pseudanabaena sp. PCC 6802]|uniref:NIL domain-containing protein n=1 Tax=Pseudanabaena sp. PCC 6802 TaxID=118173 RepID=UPI00038060CB
MSARTQNAQFDHQLNRQQAIQERLAKHHITLRVPQTHHQEPIVSNFVSEHGLTVNITAALLGENTREDGWFNLELVGTDRQIQSALVYLEELDLEFWEKQNQTEETW